MVAPARSVTLVTGANLPRPDEETAALAAALHAAGHAAEIRAWQEPEGWDRADLVVVRSPWDYVGRRDDFLAWAAAVPAPVANPPSVLGSNSHKAYLLDLAADGVPVPPLTLLHAGAGATECAAAIEAHPGPVVVKPAVGNGGRGAVMAQGDEALDALADGVAGQDMLVQDYCADVTEGEVSLVFLGGAYSHAVRKTPAPGDYRVHAHYGGSVGDHDATDEEQAIAARALRWWDEPLLYARVDLVATSEGPAVIEVELVEPELFLLRSREAMGRMVRAVEAYGSPFPTE